MVIVTINKAKAELSDLIARAEAGEEVLISRDEKPAVKLVPVPNVPDAPPNFKRVAGSLAHLHDKIPDSFFFDPLPEEELEAWEGKYSLDGEE